MDNFHLLISYLIALANFAKDIHYNCKSFGTHLFMDTVYDDLYEFTDTIRESVIMAAHQLPHSSQGYLMAAAAMVPPIDREDMKANLDFLMALIEFGSLLVNGTEGTTRGQNALLDDIAGHLDKANGLTFMLMRKFGEPVQESVKVEHCKGCIEKAVDRAKAILAKIDDKKVAETVLDYSNQHAAMCEDTEEDALDKLSKKLGV